MSSVDYSVESALNFSVKMANLNGQLLLAVLERLVNLIKGSDEFEKDRMFMNGKNNSGEMKINELFEKHSQGKIDFLDNEITKKEMKAIQKQLKEYGVDFSIVKNGKDNYDLFFAGKDRESIELGLQKAIEKFSKSKNKFWNKNKDTKTKKKEPNKDSEFKFNTEGLREKQKEKNREQQSKARKKSHEHER